MATTPGSHLWRGTDGYEAYMGALEPSNCARVSRVVWDVKRMFLARRWLRHRGAEPVGT